MNWRRPVPTPHPPVVEGHTNTNMYHTPGGRGPAPSRPEPPSLLQELGKQHGAGPPHSRAASPTSGLQPGLDDKAGRRICSLSPTPATLSPLVWVASTGCCFNAVNAFHGTSTKIHSTDLWLLTPSEPNAPLFSHGHRGVTLRPRGGP